MAAFIARGALALALVAATACEQPRSAGEEHADSSSVVGGHTTPAPAESGAHAADEHAGHAAPAGAGERLLPIMQRLGSNMTALTHALLTDDHEAVTRNAAAIAAHAPIAPEELERIRAELGAEMEAFEVVDESVHVAAVRLHEAAEARNTAGVLEALADVQRGCVACHASFRERLRTNR